MKTKRFLLIASHPNSLTNFRWDLINKLKENYERISYIIFLLNKPKRSSKKLDKDTLSWYNTLKNHSKEAIIDENKDVLSTFKQLVREGKMKNE